MGTKSGTSTVTSRWDGDMRATVSAGAFKILADERGSAGDTGPQPTDLLLAAVASCFTLSMVFEARKRTLDLPGLVVTAVGSYEGPSFQKIVISVRSDAPGEIVERLIPSAERVCWVTNTLRTQPRVEVRAEA